MDLTAFQMSPDLATFVKLVVKNVW